MHRIIFLTGMPGAGKTFWGRRWAKAAGHPFFDLDEEIEKREGHSIAGLFERGESHFRAAEFRALKSLVTGMQESCIIATGGGTVTTAGCREMIAAHGCSVFLDVAVPVLRGRLLKDIVKRPLLQGNGLEGKLEALYSDRRKWYAAADLCYEDAELTEQTIFEILNRCTNPLSLPAQ